jgi:ubiquinone biosynthesis UbiH/UbiF/VisC/COQ6 family hydroxylase
VLYAALKGCDNVSLIAPARVQRLRPVADGMELLVGDRVCRAALVVVADGANSTLLQSLGVHTHIKDYQQTALIANVALTEAHGGMAYERFTDEGPIALLPLLDAGREHRAALVWTLTPERAAELMATPDADFVAELHRRFGFRAGAFQRIGSRHCYPLKLMVAEEQVRSQLVVAGNAAHFLHPVAGQGFNLALRDVARLAEFVLAAVAEGKAPGDLALLESYLAAQQADQENTILFSHSLPALFGQSALAPAALRNVGLIAMDLIGPLRQEFARFGAGLLAPGMKLRV